MPVRFRAGLQAGHAGGSIKKFRAREGTCCEVSAVYAIFDDGGKQYKVAPGDVVLVDNRDLPEGQNQISFDKVLMVGVGADARIGRPWVDGASVSGTVLERLRTPKVRGVKFSRRKGYFKRWGHRQTMLRVQISAINA